MLMIDATLNHFIRIKGVSLDMNQMAQLPTFLPMATFLRTKRDHYKLGKTLIKCSKYGFKCRWECYQQLTTEA